MPVFLRNRQRRPIAGARLKRIAAAVLAAEGCHPEAELSVVIGDDAWMQELNQDYTGRETPTDVLAFPQDVALPGEGVMLGDVAISAETAARQAETLGHSLMAELALLLTHGILHLTGWEDKTPNQRRRMMARARKLLREIAPDLAP